MFVPIASFIAMKFITVLITKKTLTKLLKNTVDDSSKLKNMSDESHQALFDLSKTFILHSGRC